MNNNLHNDENEYKEVISELRSLKKVEAKPGFEADLFRKINSQKYAPAEKNNLFSLIFSKLILFPAAGFAVVIIAFVLFRSESPTSADPWTDMIKERPDVYAVSPENALTSESFTDSNSEKTPSEGLADVKISGRQSEKLPPPTSENITAEPSEFSSMSAAGKSVILDSLRKEKDTPLMFKSSSVNKEELDSLKSRIFKRSE